MNVVPKPPKAAQKRKTAVFPVKLHFAWRKSATKFLCVTTFTNNKVVRHWLAYLSVRKLLMGDVLLNVILHYWCMFGATAILSWHLMNTLFLIPATRSVPTPRPPVPRCTPAPSFSATRSMDDITVRQVRQPAVSLVLTHSARQPATSSTDCDPGRLASMISLQYLSQIVHSPLKFLGWTNTSLNVGLV